MYKIIREKSLAELEKVINFKIKAGFNPIGGLIKTEENSSTIYAQAVVKVNHVSPLPVHPIHYENAPVKHFAENKKESGIVDSLRPGTLDEFKATEETYISEGQEKTYKS